jgi:hypothetical protein
MSMTLTKRNKSNLITLKYINPTSNKNKLKENIAKDTKMMRYKCEMTKMKLMQPRMGSNILTA